MLTQAAIDCADWVSGRAIAIARSPVSPTCVRDAAARMKTEGTGKDLTDQPLSPRARQPSGRRRVAPLTGVSGSQGWIRQASSGHRDTCQGHRHPHSGPVLSHYAYLHRRCLVTATEPAHLGAELRRMREDTGLTGVQVAAAVGWTQSKFSRVETGRFSASLPELALLLDFYGVAEDVRAELLARSARRAGVEGAWVVRAGGPRARQASLSVVESRAVALRQFQAAVVPGLLQTPAYARAVSESGGYADVGEMVRRRTSRQREYFAVEPQYEVVLSESVLMGSAASPAVMSDQLARLLDVPEGVSVRVLPLSNGLAVTPLASFLMFDFGADRPGVILVESQTADLYLSSPADLAAHDAMFQDLTGAALTVDESASRIDLHRRRLSRSSKKGQG